MSFLKGKEKTNDTIESSRSSSWKWSSSNSERFLNYIATPCWRSLAWLQRETAISCWNSQKYVATLLQMVYFFPMEIFYSLYFSILWLREELGSKIVAVWQVYRYPWPLSSQKAVSGREFVILILLAFLIQIPNFIHPCVCSLTPEYFWRVFQEITLCLMVGTNLNGSWLTFLWGGQTGNQINIKSRLWKVL